MTTKISSNVLASGAALTNINAGSTIDFTKNVSMSGNLTVDTNTFFVDSVNNRVGIGTTTPISPLDVLNNTSNSIARFTHSNSSAIFLNRTASVYNGFGFQDSDSEKWFVGQKSNSNNIVVRNNGNADTISIEFPSPQNTVYINSFGRIGLGTDTPNEKLTVVGNISATGTATATNLVYNTTDQTIAGIKTFSNNIVGNGTSNTLPNQTLSGGGGSIITQSLGDSRYGGPIYLSALSAPVNYTNDATGTTVCSVTLPAGTYQMDVFFRFTANAANCKITTAVTFGQSELWTGYRGQYSNGGSPARIAGSNTSWVAGGPWGATSNADNHERYGILQISGTVTYSIIASQNTTSATTTTLAAGGYIMARKIL